MAQGTSSKIRVFKIAQKTVRPSYQVRKEEKKCVPPPSRVLCPSCWGIEDASVSVWPSSYCISLRSLQCGLHCEQPRPLNAAAKVYAQEVRKASLTRPSSTHRMRKSRRAIFRPNSLSSKLMRGRAMGLARQMPRTPRGFTLRCTKSYLHRRAQTSSPYQSTLHVCFKCNLAGKYANIITTVFMCLRLMVHLTWLEQPFHVRSK